jgi:GTP-binding protein
MADIPGIIEGAHEGKGLGHRFLRHIERNSALLFMVPADADDVVDEYNVLLNELEQYNPELLDKERVLAVSKCDMLDEELKTELAATINLDIPVVYISSVSQTGIQELKDVLWSKMKVS